MSHLRNIIAAVVFAFILPLALTANKEKSEEDSSVYQFKEIIKLDATPVKDQASSGTCWSYATVSFLESELLRMGKGEHDLSEMYFVRMVYPQKALKYIRYHGMANFGEGGQGHDVTNIIKEFGVVPEEVYSGINYDFSYHNHNELSDVLKSILDKSLQNKASYTGKALELFNSALDIYMGEKPIEFTYKDKNYTPISFALELGLNSGNYIEFTSYSSYPYYDYIDLEIPDNWSHDKYYNLPIDELMEVVKNAFDKGYTVNWDGDVSSKGFSHKNGVAIVPENQAKNMEDSERAKWEDLTEKEKGDYLFGFKAIVKEKNITEKIRQDYFDKFKTTDDHLMHLIGMSKDQKGNVYYITKNSWADDSNDFGGYLHMSESYIRLNTTAIQVHIDAIPPKIKEKIGLK